MQKLLTLCIVHQNDLVLLGMKKRGFGEGRWNGFGGKVHENETIEEGAAREMVEEAGITPIHYEKLGILSFTFENEPDTLQTHVYKCTHYDGEIGESEEMRPEWFLCTEVPFDQMWKDDIFWFPLFLQNKLFKGKFHFDADHNIMKQELGEVVSIE